MASKFDNRLKEFAERWEVDKYLSATGYLPANVKPFFIALPKVGVALLRHCRASTSCENKLSTASQSPVPVHRISLATGILKKHIREV